MDKLTQKLNESLKKRGLNCASACKHKNPKGFNGVTRKRNFNRLLRLTGGENPGLMGLDKENAE
jgi:hypothetical protein